MPTEFPAVSALDRALHANLRVRDVSVSAKEKLAKFACTGFSFRSTYR